jgi:hypothetical protein
MKGEGELHKDVEDRVDGAPKLTLTEKFIGFIDILGYSSLTKAAEEGRGLTLDDLEGVLSLLGSEEDRERQKKRGSTICPMAPHIRKDMDFELTQAWDSVLISSEISPAGVISLISHCFDACIMLLTKGVMCRGYVKKGMIYHRGNQVFGSGHVDAVAKEKNVSFFKRDADERGTPFMEVDPAVVEYINIQPDKCVKEMFSRMVVTHDGSTAIFPIKRLSHKFIIGGIGFPRFDGKKKRRRIMSFDAI